MYAWYDHQANAVYSELDTLKVRNVFTTVAVTLNFAISLIGSYYLKRSAQRILLQTRNGKNGTVPVSHLVPWLSLSTLASYVWQIRRFPGGGYGLLMVWTGIFSLAHQYFTNSFINIASISDRCIFDYGVWTTANSGEPLVPATTWPATRLVYEGSLAALENGGVAGIYDKINYNSTNFWPQHDDLLGFWNCTQEANGTITPSDWSTADNVQAWIQNQTFIYPNGAWSDSGGVLGNGSYGGVFVWSASFEEDEKQQWDLRAIMAYPITGDSPILTSNYQCNMVHLRSGWIPPVMPAYDTLMNWSSIAYGFLQDKEQDQYGPWLEAILNGMVMISGSNNSANSVIPGGGTYGCLLPGTQIGLEVFVLLATLVVVLLWLVAKDLYALVLYWRDPTHSRVRDIPIDYISWQLDAVREATSNAKLSERELGRYELGWVDDKNALGFKEATGEDVGVPLLPVQNEVHVAGKK